MTVWFELDEYTYLTFFTILELFNFNTFIENIP